MNTIESKGPNQDRQGKHDNRCFISLEKSLKPLLDSMKVAAVYFDPSAIKNNKAGNGSACRHPSWMIACRVYCYSVLMVLWLNFARCVVGLFPSDEGLPFRIIITCWYLQCALNSTIMVASCAKLKHLRSFYKHWDTLFNDTVTLDIGCGFRCPLKYLKVATVAGWSLIVVNTTVMCSLLFGNTSMSRYVIVNVVRPLPESVPVIIFVTLAHLLASGAWIFPVMFISIVSRVIRAQFLLFGKGLHNQINEADGRIPDRLPELRCRYTRLCKAVDIINGSFKWMLGVSFILQILLACFISYQLVSSPPEVASIATTVFWLSTCIIVILILTISSSDLHDAAHSLLEDIFRMGTKDATSQQIGQIALFLAKLTGTSVGFTAVDFFVITKEFLLTLAGLYVTYFFLLIQFKLT